MHNGKIVGGISLLVIGIIIYATISNYQAQCKSLLGQVGQFVDPSIQQKCTIVNYGIILAGALVLIGIILAIVASPFLTLQRHTYCNKFVKRIYLFSSAML